MPEWDWKKIYQEAGPAPAPAPLEQIETCWRMVGLSKKVITCVVYEVQGPGVEVRCGYSDDDLLRSERVGDMEHARTVAELWRQTVLAKGSFTELPLDDGRV